jgi:hypothetical protein
MPRDEEETGAAPRDEPTDTAPIAFDEAVAMVPRELRNLRCAIRNDSVNFGHVRTVYYSALNLARAGVRAKVRQRAGVDAPAAIGDEFERAALSRLLAWLDTEPAVAGVVQSVWRDVKVARPGSETVVAQLDIALVLRHGLLMSLECKSFNVQRKDIDARLAVLQRSTSQLAPMAVCAPWYTGYRNRPWFPAMEDVADRVRDWGQVMLVPLTLPGQPQSYVDGRGEQRQVGTFEQALSGWLDRYVPAARD